VGKYTPIRQDFLLLSVDYIPLNEGFIHLIFKQLSEIFIMVIVILKSMVYRVQYSLQWFQHSRIRFWQHYCVSCKCNDCSFFFFFFFYLVMHVCLYDDTLFGGFWVIIG